VGEKSTILTWRYKRLRKRKQKRQRPLYSWKEEKGGGDINLESTNAKVNLSSCGGGQSEKPMLDKCGRSPGKNSEARAINPQGQYRTYRRFLGGGEKKPCRFMQGRRKEARLKREKKWQIFEKRGTSRHGQIQRGGEGTRGPTSSVYFHI